MDDEKFNMSLRKFLKEVGVTSQREIEAFVRGRDNGGTLLNVKMVLTAEGTDFSHTVEGKIVTE